MDRTGKGKRRKGSEKREREGEMKGRRGMGKRTLSPHLVQIFWLRS